MTRLGPTRAYDAADYYARHYQGPTDADWVEWHRQGLWPRPSSDRSLADFAGDTSHGVVYRMLARRAPFRRALDIGCSAGDFLLPIRRACEEAWGIDIAAFPGAWAVLLEHYGISCQRHDLDKADLPFPDGHFSLVTMIMALEHVFDVDHAVREIARVLEPGGCTVVQVPNIAYIKHRLALLAGLLPITADTSDADFDKSWDGQHLHNFTLAALRRVLQKHGLQAIDCRCFGRLSGIRSVWPSLLGADLTVLARRTD